MTGPIDLPKLAHLVQQKLSDQGLTLRQAANISGISFPTLSRIKNCCTKSSPDLSTLDKLSDWLEIPLNQLVQILAQRSFPEFLKQGEETIEVHFRCRRKKMEASSAEVKKTIVKIVRLAYKQF